MGLYAGIPLGRAVQIVHAEVASRVRGMIIDACAAKRSDNTTAEMEHLLRCPSESPSQFANVTARVGDDASSASLP